MDLWSGEVWREGRLQELDGNPVEVFGQPIRLFGGDGSGDRQVQDAHEVLQAKVPFQLGILIVVGFLGGGTVVASKGVVCVGEVT